MPPEENQPSAEDIVGVPLSDVLDDFREAVAKAAGDAVADARERADVRTGRRPAFGIDGLDVELAVGVRWSEERNVRIDFNPRPDVASRLRFRVQALPTTAVQSPYMSITPVYDPAGTYGRHEYEVELRDEENTRVSFATYTVSIQRDDRDGGQVAVYQMQGDRNGSARIVVNTVEGTVTLPDGETRKLPAKTARSWMITVDCSDPVATAEQKINAPRRSRGK